MESVLNFSHLIRKELKSDSSLRTRYSCATRNAILSRTDLTKCPDLEVGFIPINPVAA